MVNDSHGFNTKILWHVIIGLCWRNTNPLFINLPWNLEYPYQGWGTRTRSARVLNFLYSYCTCTRELQSNSTRTCTCTRGQVLMYSYEYWHEYWYSMVHLMICDVRVKKHHTCQINSLTYHEGKFSNWFILLLWLNIWYMGCDCKFHKVFQFHYHRKSTELLLWCLGLLLSFVQVHSPI